MHFKVDARAMLTWGRESIKEANTAVLELVKNSYDAGATVVEIEISAAIGSGSSIRIADNGEGMSELDIANRWLRIGYSYKTAARTTGKGRRRTGEKGVGRISADRLGAILQLRTKKKRHPARGIEVRWNEFEADGLELGDVPISALSDTSFLVPADHPRGDQRAASNARPGTELLIQELRDDWDQDDIIELKRILSSLTPPFGEVVDFEVRVGSDVAPDEDGPIVSPYLEAAEIESHFALSASGRVSCTFIERGKSGKRKQPRSESYTWGQFVHSMRRGASTKPKYGEVKAVFLFYPRSRETVRGTDLGLSDLKKYLNQNAGVKVYRDLVRVLPYGDPYRPEGDWLALGDRKARDPAGAGRPSFKVAPNQVVGAVFLSRDGNPKIADTSGREGLINGAALERLKEFLLGCLVAVEARYHKNFVARLSKESAADPPRQVVKDLRTDLSGLSGDLKKVESSLSAESAEVVDDIRERIADTQRRIESADKSLEGLASCAAQGRCSPGVL